MWNLVKYSWMMCYACWGLDMKCFEGMAPRWWIDHEGSDLISELGRQWKLGGEAYLEEVGYEGVPLKGLSCFQWWSLPISSLLNGYNEVNSFLCHTPTTILFVVSQISWSFWYHEPKWIFPPLSCFFQLLGHSYKKLINYTGKILLQHWLCCKVLRYIY
jgi:hypothetical protein